jgi:hypothetical protein
MDSLMRRFSRLALAALFVTPSWAAAQEVSLVVTTQWLDAKQRQAPTVAAF